MEARKPKMLTRVMSGVGIYIHFLLTFFFFSSPKYSLMNIYHLLIQDLSTVSLLHTKDYARGYGYSGEQDNPYPQGA